MRRFFICLLGSFLGGLGFIRSVFAAYCTEFAGGGKVAEYTISDVSGQEWYVGWLNSNYTGSATTWAGDASLLDHSVRLGTGAVFYVPRTSTRASLFSSDIMRRYCFLAWDSRYYLPELNLVQFQRGCATAEANPGALYALGDGLFSEMGCCRSSGLSIDSATGAVETGTSGTTGYNPTNCPCFYAGTVESTRYEYMYEASTYTTNIIDVEKVCYGFDSCKVGYYQSVGDGSYYPYSSDGFCVLLQPGASGEGYPCAISGGISNTTSYCSTAGCTETGVYNLKKVWPGSCISCPSLDYANTVDGLSNYTAKYSTEDAVGIGGCTLVSYTATAAKGKVEYSCNSSYQ